MRMFDSITLISLYKYMWFKETRLENDVVQLINNVNYRQSNPYDHFEMICAWTRLEVGREVFNEIKQILEGYR